MPALATHVCTLAAHACACDKRENWYALPCREHPPQCQCAVQPTCTAPKPGHVWPGTPVATLSGVKTYEACCQGENDARVGKPGLRQGRIDCALCP